MTNNVYVKLKEYVESLELRRLSEFRETILKLNAIVKEVLNELAKKYEMVVIRSWKGNDVDKDNGKYLVIEDPEVFEGLIALNNMYHLLIRNGSRKHLKEQFSKSKKAIIKLLDILINST